MNRAALLAATVGLLTGALAFGGGPVDAAAPGPGWRSSPPLGAFADLVVAQPRPRVAAVDFPVEPMGRAPLDNDGLIPNPSTPTGAVVGPPPHCTVSFSSTAGATSATVNAWIRAHQNGITVPTVVCLSGVFTGPIHIWSKTSTALLELAPAPRTHATLDLGVVNGEDVNANQYWDDSGGVSIVGSRSVEIYGLTVENYTFDGTAQVPAGIYVTARSGTGKTGARSTGYPSACFLRRGSCSDIYIIANTVKNITNTADEDLTSRSGCGNGNINAYGIAVIAAGSAMSPKLQHVVVEDNTVYGTRTGQSETMTFNGAIKDFLVAGNFVHDVDNIGIDTIGWETGGAQADHGWVYKNTVYDVDTLSNAGYGRWDRAARRCVPLPEGAAGIYDDGASYIWVDANTVWDTDQGIDLDVETPGKETDHLLVSNNLVHDDPGTSTGDPSYGPGPPGVARSTVAGHDVYALYADAYGARASIADVYVHDNVFQDQSQQYLDPPAGMPVVDLGGNWSGVEIWHNTIEGLGRADKYNPLLEVDQEPGLWPPDIIDCNDYADLSTSTQTVNGNFALPSSSFLTIAGWQAGNGHGWDAHSRVGGFSPACPRRSVP